MMLSFKKQLRTRSAKTFVNGGMMLLFTMLLSLIHIILPFVTDSAFIPRIAVHDAASVHDTPFSIVQPINFPIRPIKAL